MDSQDIISKLKFIGEIKKDHKVNVSEVQLQPNTYATSFLRTFVTKDNRSNTIAFLKNVIHKIFQIIILLKAERKQREFDNLISDLDKAVIGLHNLKTTYESDVKFCCDLDLLVQEIQTVLIREKPNTKKKKDD